MRIIYSYKSRESFKDFDAPEVVIGRPLEGVNIDLDLTPDTKASRPHARIWTEYKTYWVEDLNSVRGTRLNGVEIKGQGRKRLHSGDILFIGETILRLDIPPEEESVSTLPPDKSESELVGEITQSLDALKPPFSPAAAAASFDPRLALLYELPLRFAEETQLEALLRLIIERAVGVIPGATRGALLIVDRETGQLLLAASLPADNPAVSLTLARKAIERLEGFIWSRPESSVEEGDEADAIPGSASEYNIESAIYAPLLLRREALGVVCVDNNKTSGAFHGDDLRLLQALAHHAATAVAHLRSEKDLRHEAKVLNNFLKLVSPQLAERLTQYRGPIRLGGEFCEATILFSDIRGFTKLSRQMQPEDVGEMLEDYFGRLVPIIFKHQGMVDKYVGDAIVAVFGSPAADAERHRHAVQAALEMQEVMREINLKREAQGKLAGELGIGIHCGEVVHGFIGSPERMEFTVIGDAVNLASRYCDGADKGEVLISPDMYQWVWKSFHVEQTNIPTKHEGDLTAYRVKGAKG